MSADQFQAPDYFLLDDLLTEEHKLSKGCLPRLGEERSFSHN